MWRFLLLPAGFILPLLYVVPLLATKSEEQLSNQDGLMVTAIVISAVNFTAFVVYLVSWIQTIRRRRRRRKPKGEV